MYDTRSGWWLTDRLFSRAWLSRLYGWWQGRRWSRRHIRPFAAAHGIDLSEARLPLDAFPSFNAFIAREIDLARRPVTREPDACACPADCRVWVHPRLTDGLRLPLKRARYDLATLLDDAELARAYAGGAVLVGRLYLADYHHFHFPDGGVPGTPRVIAGRCYATSPYTTRHEVPFLARNVRSVTPFASDSFGTLLQVEIGAFTVASIRQAYTPGERVARGAHKGWFELGGSVVLLLFEAGRIVFDPDLVAHSAAGVETFVRMGERIGRAV
jgi:phosphatidylserine decarboxylase